MVTDMLTYLHLMASKFGGSSWLTHDMIFHRNKEGVSRPWNELDAAMHRVYIANAAETYSMQNIAMNVFHAKHCHEVDHQASECAVAAVLLKCQHTQPAPPMPTGADRSSLAKGKAPTLATAAYVSHLEYVEL